MTSEGLIGDVCKQVCVADCSRAIRPSLVKACKVDGFKRVERWSSRGCDDGGKPERGSSLVATVRPWTCREPIDTRFTVLPPYATTPPPTSATSFFLCFLSGLFWSLSWRGTVKPQGAFREDPVTRALALSSALTKSATEREQTRALRETALRSSYTAHPTEYPPLDRYLDILPPCLSTCPSSPPNIFLSLSPVASPTLFTPISPKRYLHRSVRSQLPSTPRFIAQISIASCPPATLPVWKGPIRKWRSPFLLIKEERERRYCSFSESKMSELLYKNYKILLSFKRL